MRNFFIGLLLAIGVFYSSLAANVAATKCLGIGCNCAAGDGSRDWAIVTINSTPAGLQVITFNHRTGVVQSNEVDSGFKVPQKCP